MENKKKQTHIAKKVKRTLKLCQNYRIRDSFINFVGIKKSRL